MPVWTGFVPPAFPFGADPPEYVCGGCVPKRTVAALKPAELRLAKLFAVTSIQVSAADMPLSAVFSTDPSPMSDSERKSELGNRKWERRTGHSRRVRAQFKHSISTGKMVLRHPKFDELWVRFAGQSDS